VNARLRRLQNAQPVSGEVSQICRFFGVPNALFYSRKTAFRIIRYDYQINFNANWISLFVVEVVSIKPALAIGAPVWSKRV